MTIHLSSLGQVYLVCGKTDMRQGIDSLAYMTQKLYGKSSEKSVCPSGQLNLFEEESPSEEDGDVPS
ncbi:putative transposase remnant (pseudogene) [Streptococcus pneumoniae]|nr:putative transposase remnant (pseudogene) [Streptococcus pneumoniae]VLE78738.1 putative transposase remnant (pseudogene) [Streptococcus pneumoniae]VLM44490.1 putative transposase remnant (pseudogene) [Streptococcus pneumoniae]VML49340.1 putative transposase remnant (pseudogene) [Streptococcus pneumoniae]VMS16892.1 putative transposase remnant (pseudogene) [Streptococcus pneumoniae]